MVTTGARDEITNTCTGDSACQQTRCIHGSRHCPAIFSGDANGNSPGHGRRQIHEGESKRQ